MNTTTRPYAHSRRLACAIGVFALSLVPAGLVLAGSAETKLAPPDPVTNGIFGSTSAVDGDVAVFGAPNADVQSGAAYVYVRSGGAWTLSSRLTASSPSPSRQFGSAVAVSRDTVFVGAWKDDGYAGSVYVFTRNAAGAWTQRQRLTASDSSNDLRFGVAVAMSGDTAVVGAAGDAGVAAFSGAAYVFVRDAGGVWKERQKLKASDLALRDFFGASVAISGGTAVVGAPRIVPPVPTPGVAYVFQRDAAGAWTERGRLTATDGAAGQGFGSSVAVSGDTVVVGAAGNDGSRGAAYVFGPDAAGTWTERQRLRASDAAMHDRYGTSVAVSGGTMLVGAVDDADAGSQSGSVYVLARGADGLWTERRKLLPSDGANGDKFGSTVALSRDIAVVGAPNDDDGGDDSGSAYAYLLATTGDLSGTERLRGRGMARAAGAVTGSLTLDNGEWTLLDGAGRGFSGTYVQTDRAGLKFDLTYDDASIAALLAALGRSITGPSDGKSVTAALRGSPRIAVRFDRDKKTMVLTATARVTSTAEGEARPRRGVYALRLSGPVASVR